MEVEKRSAFRDGFEKTFASGKMLSAKGTKLEPEKGRPVSPFALIPVSTANNSVK
jgi:hypothetical protein